MSENQKDTFLKLFRSDSTDFLQSNHPNAFLLLIQISKSARRYSGALDGLEVGDSIIGEIETSKKSGLSSKKYRTALKKLIELGFIEVVFNPRDKKTQKRAIKRAIKSMIVNLKDSSILDINPETRGDQKGDQRAIKGRTEGDKQERTRKNNNEQETTTTPLPPKLSNPKDRVVVVDFFNQLEKELNIRQTPSKQQGKKDPQSLKPTSDNICSVSKSELTTTKPQVLETNPKQNESKPNYYIHPSFESFKVMDVVGNSLDEKDKIKISSKFNPEQIENGLNYVKQYKKEIGTIGAFVWKAIEEKYQVTVSKNDIQKEIEIQREKTKMKHLLQTQKNRDFAKQFDSFKNQRYSIRASNSDVTFKDEMRNTTMSMIYAEDNFDERFRIQLKSYGFNPNFNHAMQC